MALHDLIRRMSQTFGTFASAEDDAKEDAARELITLLDESEDHLTRYADVLTLSIVRDSVAAAVDLYIEAETSADGDR